MLSDQGHRFYCDPETKDCRWLTPELKKHSRAGWVDQTDISDDQLAAWLMSEAVEVMDGQIALL